MIYCIKSELRSHSYTYIFSRGLSESILDEHSSVLFENLNYYYRVHKSAFILKFGNSNLKFENLSFKYRMYTTFM